LAYHHAAKGPQEEERAAQIQVGYAVIFLVRVVQHQFSDVNRGRADRDVEALVLAVDRSGERSHRVSVAGVDDVRFGMAIRDEVSHSRLDAIFVLVSANHSCAERRQQFSRCLADARCSAENERDLAIEAKQVAVGL
jgi:hypothetical protein